MMRYVLSLLVACVVWIAPAVAQDGPLRIEITEGVIGLDFAMIAEAEVADAHFLHTGKSHLLWGNGSLMGAARKRVLADEPTFLNTDYCVCFEIVLRSLIRHQITEKHSRCTG